MKAAVQSHPSGADWNEPDHQKARTFPRNCNSSLTNKFYTHKQKNTQSTKRKTSDQAPTRGSRPICRRMQFVPLQQRNTDESQQSPENHHRPHEPERLHERRNNTLPPSVRKSPQLLQAVKNTTNFLRARGKLPKSIPQAFLQGILVGRRCYRNSDRAACTSTQDYEKRVSIGFDSRVERERVYTHKSPK
jgi:hypothetical protein